MKLLFLAFLANSLVSFADDQSEMKRLPQPPIALQDFKKLNVPSASGLKEFALNVGLKSYSDSTIRNILYTSTNMKKWIFVQAGMAVIDKSLGEITTLPNGQSFFYIKGKTNFFILSRGLERDEVLKLQKDIYGSSKSLKEKFQAQEHHPKVLNFVDWFLRLNIAYGSASKCISSSDIQNSLQSKNESDFKVLKAATACLNGGGMGTWEATGGALSFMYDVLTKGSEQILCAASGVALNYSWRMCSEYAEAMGKSIDQTMYTVGSIKQVAIQVIDGFSELPGDAQARVFCELGGAAATGAMISFATVGAGAPVALTRVSEILKKVSEMPEMSKSSGTLKNLAAKVEQKAQAESAALATSQTLPTDLKNSLENIKNLRKEEYKKYEQVQLKGRIYLDKSAQVSAVGPSRMQVSLRLREINKKLSWRSMTQLDTKEMIDDLLRYGKLTDEEKALALKYQSFEAMPDDRIPNDILVSDVAKLAASIKKRELEVNPDMTFMQPDRWAKALKEEKDADDEFMRATRELKEAVTKTDAEIARSERLIETKYADSKDKATYRAKIAAYSGVVLCNVVSGKGLSSTGDSTQKGDR